MLCEDTTQDIIYLHINQRDLTINRQTNNQIVLVADKLSIARKQLIVYAVVDANEKISVAND